MERKVLIGLGVVVIILILYTHHSTIRVSRHELEALSDQQHALLDKAGPIRHKKERIQRAVVALRSVIQELQSQVKTLNTDIQTMEQDIKALEGGLERSDRAVARIKTAPLWNLYSLDTALVLIILLCILWLVYRWHMDHRRLTAGTTDRELKVLEGRKEKPSAASAGMEQRKKA